MSRPLRVCLPDITYHVFSRCLEWKNMMAEDFFKDILIDVLAKSQEKYDYELIFYEILDNHFHFIIKTVNGGATISRILQFIKARFAEKFNKIMDRIGPFWNERFKDIIIDFQDNPLNYFLWLLWYIAFNPVRKNIVQDPREYKYGCINNYLSDNYLNPLKIVRHYFFNLLGNTFEDRVRNFLYYEEVYRRRLLYMIM